MAEAKGPLDGIRVLDLGRHQAGPRAAQVLARMGAEVIKLERLGGEETRYHAPWVRKQSAYWVQYNSGKKSLSIDLRKEDGKEILRELVKVSDVLVQNCTGFYDGATRRHDQMALPDRNSPWSLRCHGLSNRYRRVLARVQ